MADVQNWDWTRAIFDHIHLRVGDLERSRAFYAAALEPLGIPLLLDTPHLIQFASRAPALDCECSRRVSPLRVSSGWRARRSPGHCETSGPR